MADGKTQISIRIPTEMLQMFDRIAAGVERDRSFVMNEAFRLYMESEGKDLLEEIEGFAELDAGHGVDADEMISKARAIVARRRSEQAR
ncbi:ribbon-helix-helix domain-containing protein [Devosia sp. BK]|uniref:CopG family ribbon-helix-helix protein n=1 Tax=Devosia sp. BK TaxID=2871706 RepID=UPI00293A7F3A|nr:transcriptional regulator [Devosia sp. BK]MDV3251136.1 ribbon-helix-helix domain-containing protein [Devosia sp. BK]